MLYESQQTPVKAAATIRFHMMTMAHDSHAGHCLTEFMYSNIQRSCIAVNRFEKGIPS